MNWRLNKSSIYWLCQIIGWGGYGIIQITLFSVAGRVDSQLVIGQLSQVLFYIFLTHILRAIILRRDWIRFRWLVLLPRVVGVNFALSIAHFIFLVSISWLNNDLNPDQDLNPFSIIASLIISMTLFMFWSLIYVSFLYFERYNKSLQHEAAIKDVELSNLKAQLNPHFIFNALNSIRALVDENPHKSKMAITQLSNILRKSLSTQRKELVDFGEELDMVKDYLALESIRYEERLKTSFVIDEASYSYRIPPLMLQTLVENGIKHGISTLKQGGNIHIETREQPGGLQICIRNSGHFAANKSGVGYGLLNTRKRLALIYGEATQFSIDNEDEKTVRTSILIPKMI